MSNFLFLKKNNENLFNIISEAENLFRDEYFEQSMVQIRRFAENLCRDLLQDKVSPDDTFASFDTLICKIKDNSFKNMRMKEFADDLYFLKKHGNTSAHSSSANKKEHGGKIALECLERAYEISILYSNVKYGYNKKLDKTVFSEELLMTGKKTGRKSKPKALKERYSDELKKTRAKTSSHKIKKIQKIVKKSRSRKKKSKNKILPIFILITLVILVYLFMNYIL